MNKHPSTTTFLNLQVIYFLYQLTTSRLSPAIHTWAKHGLRVSSWLLTLNTKITDMKRAYYTLLLITFLLSFYASSQVNMNNQLIGSAGTNFSNSTCQLSFSIGETLTSSLTSSSLLLTQGFQQPIKWKSTNSLSITDFTNSGIDIYPNPFSTTITIINENNLQLRCRLYDLTNRLVNDFDMNEHVHSIDLSHLPAGTYHLVFTNNDSHQFTFPLIKIN